MFRHALLTIFFMNNKHMTAPWFQNGPVRGFETAEKQKQGYKQKHDELSISKQVVTSVSAKQEAAFKEILPSTKRPTLIQGTPCYRRFLLNRAQSNSLTYKGRQSRESQNATTLSSRAKNDSIAVRTRRGQPNNTLSVPSLDQKSRIDGQLRGTDRKRASPWLERHGDQLKSPLGTGPFRGRGRRRRFERAQQKASADEFCLIAVKKTKNNTHCTISRLFGDQKTLWTTSGGQTPTIGSKSNGRRKSRYCQRMIFKAATEKLLGLGLKYLVIHCIGRAISKRYIFRNFYRRFRIVLLKDLLAVAHNGCRPKKVRRL